MAPAQYIAGLLRRLRKRNSPSEAPHIRTGRRGEAIAARVLRKKGHRILYRNFRPPDGGEIDLVTRDRRARCLVFVEVKTRHSDQWTRPLDAVNAKKRRLILRGASAWLRMLDRPEVPFRFDVVEVILDPPMKVRVIEGAFDLPGNSLY